MGAKIVRSGFKATSFHPKRCTNHLTFDSFELYKCFFTCWQIVRFRANRESKRMWNLKRKPARTNTRDLKGTWSLGSLTFPISKQHVRHQKADSTRPAHSALFYRPYWNLCHARRGCKPSHR